MKNQALFSSNDKSKKLKCRQLQFLFGALRVNVLSSNFITVSADLLLCIYATGSDHWRTMDRLSSCRKANWKKDYNKRISGVC